MDAAINRTNFPVKILWRYCYWKYHLVAAGIYTDFGSVGPEIGCLYMESYMAISHVWNFQMGQALERAPGRANIWLWDFFAGLSKKMGCDGLWWDSIYIPMENWRQLGPGQWRRHNCIITTLMLQLPCSWYMVASDEVCMGGWWESSIGYRALAPVYKSWTALELFLSKRVSKS